ncbi:MAG: metalloregulator ArsR/SmtB family transcription factor [bacterium]
MNMRAASTTASLRFYPDYMPEFSYEPTRDRFHIGYENDHIGEGVRSLVNFAAGDVVFACSGVLCTEVTQFSLQLAPGLHLHDPYFYGKILHSCEPNTRVDLATRQFKAVRPIYPGDFVTMDYAQTEDYLYRCFPCACGAPTCRKSVQGRLQVQTSKLDVVGEQLTDLVSGPIDLFEVLSDKKRRLILEQLLLCNASLQSLKEKLSLSYRAVSTHIRVLRQAGLVHQYKIGRQVYYAPDSHRLTELFNEGRKDVDLLLQQITNLVRTPIAGVESQTAERRLQQRR